MRIPQIDINPLRVLGVYANSTLREIEQNKAQLRAFARVGQKVELPLWLKRLSLLPPMPDITEEMVTQAQSQISLQDDRDNYARFWFERDESLVQEDEKVFSLLSNNQVDEACWLLQQRTDHAAMKNLLLLSVLKDDWKMIAEISAKCFEENVAEFDLFMSEVIKASPEANGKRSHRLLSNFKRETWISEMKELLINHHKSVLDVDIDRLKKIDPNCSDISFLKKSIEDVMADYVHVKALRYLCGKESLVPIYYTTMTAKMLCTVILTYGRMNTDRKGSRWARRQLNKYWWDLSEVDQNNGDFVLFRKILDEKCGGESLVDILMEGCGPIIFIMLFGLLGRACGCGGSSRSTYKPKPNYEMPNIYKYPQIPNPIDYEMKLMQIKSGKVHDSIVNLLQSKEFDDIIKNIDLNQKSIDVHQ